VRLPLVLEPKKDSLTNVREVYANRNRSDGKNYAIDFSFEEIKALKVTERKDSQDPSKQTYPLRFPMNQASFELISFSEFIELVQGLTKSLNSIYQLDKTKILSGKKAFTTGIYVEIKEPRFHTENNKPNISEIVLSVLKQYGYSTKQDNIILQTFDPVELRRIRKELKSNLTLFQLLMSEEQYSDYAFWNSKQGLEEIASFADGVGPEINQLVKWDGKNRNSIQKSDFYVNAKALGLYINPYTLRIDSLPKYVDSFVDLLKLFVNEIKVDGLITDFPDLALTYVNQVRNSGSPSVVRFSYLIFLTVFILLFK
jgi:glycerophosphoryl diester phosphodiesterase